MRSIRNILKSVTSSAGRLSGREKKKRLLTLSGENGGLQLALQPGSIYYIESEDNYVGVWYESSDGGLLRASLRCSLRHAEEAAAGTSLLRCHRRYIVNLDKVQVLLRHGRGFEIELMPPPKGNARKDFRTLIPVSATYAKAVSDKIEGQ